jgi:hypothetical protein
VARTLRPRRLVRWGYRSLAMVLPMVVIAVLAAAVPASAVPASSARAVATATPDSLPCDIYYNAGTPCVAAYSMVRALSSNYDQWLYQITRIVNGQPQVMNIGPSTPGGYVDASAQASFCADTTCTVTEIYDQSGNDNNLTIEGGGGNVATPDQGANAMALPITVDGITAYGLDIAPGVGYRDDGPDNDGATGVATGSEPEGMYMVASGTHVNSGCCFDFGNAEKNNDDDNDGSMDAVNLTTFCGSYVSPCSGNGPWVEADLENGQYTGGEGSNSADVTNNSDFVTAMLKNNGTSEFELEGGNAQEGDLTTLWHGPLPQPSGPNQTYTPMSKQGAVLLGTGGDNSNWDTGSFFEGVMTSGFPTDATDQKVQASIVAAGFAGSSAPACQSGNGGVPSSGSSVGETSAEAGPAVVHAEGATGAGASGFSSVYTVDAGSGDLQETYLPYMGDSWTSQDLTAQFCTPPIMPGTQPVAVVHCGYTSVYTVDAGSGDLQETFLPAIGDPWTTQNLSLNYDTPPTDVTPTVIVHHAGATGGAAACGFTSVYTVDAGSGDLQETYLPYIGDSWTTQNLSANYNTPAVMSGTSPVAIVHCNYTSVYTVDAGSGDLQETYLPAIGDSWTTQNLTANYNAPPTDVTPTAVVHDAGATGQAAACGFTSVYTVDAGSGDLQETYLPYIGDAWTSQNLSANYSAPAVMPGTSPEALVHMNYTSVFTIDTNGDLQETYLPAIGDPWLTHDLSAITNPGPPATSQSPIVLLHPDASGNLDWTSVYTIDAATGDLQETYLSNVGFPGDPWVTQNLSANYNTPPVAG